MSITIPNYSTFQHYKHRRPPWIRLYRSLLDDPEWRALDAVAGRLLIELWLLASETEVPGKIDLCVEDLVWRLRYPVSEHASIMLALEALENRGFIEFSTAETSGDASNMLAQSRVEQRQSRVQRLKTSQAEARFVGNSAGDSGRNPPAVPPVQKRDGLHLGEGQNSAATGGLSDDWEKLAMATVKSVWHLGRSVVKVGDREITMGLERYVWRQLRKRYDAEELSHALSLVREVEDFPPDQPISLPLLEKRPEVAQRILGAHRKRLPPPALPSGLDPGG